MHRKLKIKQHEPTISGGELMCSGSIGSSCTTCGTRHVTLVTNHWFIFSCNNVAPVTNLCLGRATTRSHSSQWSKKKLQLKHKNSLFTLQIFHYNYYWWSQSLLNRFGWEIYAFQSWQQPCSNLLIVFHNRKLRKAELF